MADMRRIVWKGRTPPPSAKVGASMQISVYGKPTIVFKDGLDWVTYLDVDDDKIRRLLGDSDHKERDINNGFLFFPEELEIDDSLNKHFVSITTDENILSTISLTPNIEFLRSVRKAAFEMKRQVIVQACDEKLKSLEPSSQVDSGKTPETPKKERAAKRADTPKASNGGASDASLTDAI